jgi:feruloyl esterase
MKPILLAAALFSSLLWPQSDLREGFWAPPDNAPVLAPKTPCAELRALSGFAYSIATAELIPATAEVPEYCRVTGLILPSIGFELHLPSRWNQRFLMTGNGGWAGAIGKNFSSRALRRGFAVAADDSGHDLRSEPGGSFARDRQKFYDYAFRSEHMTAEVSKGILSLYYIARPRRSYFQGCSTGGRQALILAQRFPLEFDGILSGAPVLNFTGTMVQFACIAQALDAAPIPYAKLETLAARIYAGCDEKDGLKDGILDDPRRCNFSPSRDLPRCAEGQDANDCFTASQISALEKIYAPVTSQGKQVFPAWPVGSEAAPPKGRSGWDAWIVKDGAPSIARTFAEEFFRYAPIPADPAWTLSRFNLDKDSARLDWIHRVIDATEPDLSPYRKRNGKLLMYYGWADQALNPLAAVDYYEQVQRILGPTPDFFRLFMIPGMFHCGGGVGAGSTDFLPALVDWVEKGAAPERIVVSSKRDGQFRSRPVCQYPKVARYKGAGSTTEEANFTCVAPPSGN